mmetsp:Transcript_36513/g.40765  ORF Transcript_36513/g.40765 Transcript_36513/m.40765 type:complete len:435 (-) Transcript_36513:85-1389(-)
MARIRISVGSTTMTLATIISLSYWRVHSFLLLCEKQTSRITTIRNGIYQGTGTGTLSFAQSTRWSEITRIPLSSTRICRNMSNAASHSYLKSNNDKILSSDDRLFLARALEISKFGLHKTFPNPAVGCVIVRQDTGDVVGEGFHPRAGCPHAEVFALLEAAGHVTSGVEAAKSVMEGDVLEKDDNGLQRIIDVYTGIGTTQNDDDDNRQGPQKLFSDIFVDVPITAYVTLEPCCHYGRTPPCASSLALAKVDRVVVGFRDPNPRVDGGGCKVLQDAGIDVDMANDEGCARIVDAFVKRILPKDYDDQSYAHMTGRHRRILRQIAGRKKNDKTLQEVSWSAKAKNEVATDDLELPAEWMEHLDAVLWKEEIVNLRLNRAVQKKKLAKQLGERVAKQLGAHVAQAVGHTVLLYRPGIPKVLDLNALTKDDDNIDDT